MTDDVWVVAMPKLGETVTEGTVGSWRKQVGESVAFDDPLFEVSTDKVDSEIPSPYDGVVLEILVPEGETVPVGSVLARIGGPGAPGGAATAGCSRRWCAGWWPRPASTSPRSPAPGRSAASGARTWSRPSRPAA